MNKRDFTYSSPPLPLSRLPLPRKHNFVSKPFSINFWGFCLTEGNATSPGPHRRVTDLASLLQQGPARENGGLVTSERGSRQEGPADSLAQPPRGGKARHCHTGQYVTKLIFFF